VAQNIPIRPAAGTGPAVRRPGWSSQAQGSVARSARPGRTAGGRAATAKSQAKVEVDDHYLIALAKQGSSDAYDRLVKRYHSFVRLKASSYFLVGGDSEDLVQEGLVGLYKAIRDFRSDRESSFRNFAELCITRQIITAVKTATRNKHTPLNGYVSFSSTPAGAAADGGEPTLDEILPGSPVWDPANQAVSTEELRSLVACLSTVLSELESRVLSLYLDGHSYVDIGGMLGCDCKTVDNALQRVKRKVGAHLAEREVLL
jgi:RNA polymerase sporulation-specific sigma factor